LHDEFLAAGTRIVAISVDSVGQQAAMVEKLDLPFPMLSDPDRSIAITPFGVADPTDERRIATPAVVLVDTAGSEAWRFVSRDYADRLPEALVLERARALGLGPTTQRAPRPGTPEPGDRAFPVEMLPYYYRGARFAALAIGRRYKDLSEELKGDTKAFVEEVDRYFAEIVALRRRLGSG
jgi:AhpC/TSA family